jgi:hypothetical protein
MPLRQRALFALALAHSAHFAKAGCSSANPCPDAIESCCSTYGYCGNTDLYCAPSNCDPAGSYEGKCDTILRQELVGPTSRSPVQMPLRRAVERTTCAARAPHASPAAKPHIRSPGCARRRLLRRRRYRLRSSRRVSTQRRLQSLSTTGRTSIQPQHQTHLSKPVLTLRSS